MGARDKDPLKIWFGGDTASKRSLLSRDLPRLNLSADRPNFVTSSDIESSYRPTMHRGVFRWIIIPHFLVDC